MRRKIPLFPASFGSFPFRVAMIRKAPRHTRRGGRASQANNKQTWARSIRSSCAAQRNSFFRPLSANRDIPKKPGKGVIPALKSHLRRWPSLLWRIGWRRSARGGTNWSTGGQSRRVLERTASPTRPQSPQICSRCSLACFAVGVRPMPIIYDLRKGRPSAAG
jgi:hypothetical protein